MINFSSSQQAVLPSICQGRLTLTSGVPITTSNVTAATTVYFTPFRGNAVSLYDGANWNAHAFAERSISVPASTNTNYDIFIYDNAGTLTLEAVAWTDNTTRATPGIAWQDGVLVKSGSLNKRYVGTVRTTGVSGQTEDSEAKRLAWNYYNRVARTMQVIEATNTWAWTTGSWQQARATASNQLEFVIGVSEDTVRAVLVGSLTTSTVGAYGMIGIALDGTTPDTRGHRGWMQMPVANHHVSSTVTWEGLPGIGRRVLVWCELGGANVSFEGDNGNFPQSGIYGMLWG